MPLCKSDDVLYQPFPMVDGQRGQIWRYSPEYRRPRHFHAEPELDLVFAGTGVFGSGSQTFRVSAGDLICWAPGRDHELVEASIDFDLFVIGLTPELNERVLGERSVTALSGTPLVKLDAATLAGLHALCAERAVSSEPSVVDDRVGAFWQRAHASRLAAPRRQRLAERVLHSLLEQPEMARAERASVVGAYPTELSRRFRRDFGLALNDYRTRLRLLRFVGLIDGGGRTLLAAALEAGFGSYSQCHRAFRRALGCSPRTFFNEEVRGAIAARFEPWGARRCDLPTLPGGRNGSRAPLGIDAAATECEDSPAVAVP